MRKQEYLDHPYVTRQLIAYIGNKRRLLEFLSSVFSDLERPDGATRFLDPFAGSGSVSRLARLRQYSVKASDIEEYAGVLCRAALSFNPDDADHVLGGHGGYRAAIDELNSIGRNAAKDPARVPGYIERTYAPESTEHADYRRERLFYTTENAAFIDAVRDTIDRWFPPGAPESAHRRRDSVEAARTLLIAPLLVEASVHANTSGVFKAYHKGFGGHGKDALSRILAPAELEPMPLIEAPKALVEVCDAAEFCRSHSGDIAYLDPPYNQHQYGSNYFMLNTIARWDKPEISGSRNSDGSLWEKAGIRADWRETRSSFCRRNSAVDAFSDLLEAIDAGTIVLSYNTEGIVPFEALYDLLSQYGDVEIRSFDYVQFRGGRQSAGRRNQTAEIAFVVRRNEHSRPARSNVARDGAHIARSFRVSAYSRNMFVPARVLERFGSLDALLLDPVNMPATASQDGSTIQAVDEAASARFEAGIRLVGLPPSSDLQQLDKTVLEQLEDDLSYAACRDNIEEIDVLLSILESPDQDSLGLDFTVQGRASGVRQSTGEGRGPRGAGERRGPRGVGERRTHERRVLQLLRKLAHPRYVDALKPRYERFVADGERAERNRKVLESLRDSVRARCNINLHLSSER